MRILGDFMILSILAPKGGVGSSTTAVLLARAKAQSGKVLLVDAAEDPSLDLYTGTAQLVSESFTGSIPEAEVFARDSSTLSVLRLEPGNDEHWKSLEEALLLLQDTDVILDLGVPGNEAVRMISFSDEVTVVLTQDNQVLRAADLLLGDLRKEGLEASFIVNMLEDKDPAILGGLEDIFELIEEDHLGSVRFHHDLRYTMNTGSFQSLSGEILQEFDELAARIFGTAVVSDEDVPAGTEEKILRETHEAPEEERPLSVLEGIRSFFRSFRKG